MRKPANQGKQITLNYKKKRRGRSALTESRSLRGARECGRVVVRDVRSSHHSQHVLVAPTSSGDGARGCGRRDSLLHDAPEEGAREVLLVSEVVSRCGGDR